MLKHFEVECQSKMLKYAGFGINNILLIIIKLYQI